MIRTFRPWQLFERLQDNNLNLKIPNVPGTTSRTVFMLETALLIAAARIVDAKTILEIGTCQGWTAMHLAMNTGAMIHSWDIDDRPQVWENTRWHERITYNIVDTRTAVPLYQRDMVFVDADHSYDSVKRDTRLAVDMSPKVIAWHDYSNPMEPGVMKFLSEFAQDHNLINIQDSWLCFWFKDDL